MERELAEAMRKEREHIDQQRILAEKNALQLKMKAAASKPIVNPNKYSFDMLRTDDETDDEDVKSNVRPKPPQWSLRKKSTFQMYFHSKEFIFIFVVFSPRRLPRGSHC